MIETQEDKMQFRTAKEGRFWHSYEAGRVITTSGESPLLRMPIAVDVKQVGGKDSKVLRFVASTEDEDRDGDIIRVAGWQLDNFLKNPVHLWAHNMRQDNPPIGKTIKIELMNGQMINEVDFFMADNFPLAALALKAHLAGVGAESVGFLPLEAMERIGGDGRLIGFEFQKQELLEISSVPVPSNPEALIQATQKGLLTSEEATKIEKIWAPEQATPIKIYLTGSTQTKEPELKAIVPYKDFPDAPIDRPWDAAAAVERLRVAAGGPDKDKIDWAKYRTYFALWDPQNPENFGSYKLPHHDVVDGEIKDVFRGVIAAIAVINGARGGVDASDEDKRGAYNHLARHVREFDREPPPFGGAAGMSEGERKALQEYHLLMAEAYGLKITIETGEQATDEAKAIAQLVEDVKALSQRWGARASEIGRIVSQAVHEAVRAAK